MESKLNLFSHYRWIGRRGRLGVLADAVTARACRCVCPPKHGPDFPILGYFAELSFERLEPRGHICLVLGACVDGLLSELCDLSLQ